MTEEFVITYLTREDLEAMGVKEVNKLSDATIASIASKMEEMYLNRSFHEDLANILHELKLK